MEGNLINVAFADDHPVVHEGLTRFIERLEDIRFAVSAYDGQELLDGIKAGDTLPDICIVDIQMAGMDGLEAIRHIKKEWPQIRIIAFSSFADELIIKRSIELGVNGFLHKGHSFVQIADVIRRVHRGEVYFSEQETYSKTSAWLQTADRIPDLTAMEIKLLEYSITEMTWGEIAMEMNTTQKSVEGYRDSLYRKLGIKRKIGLLIYAIRLGIVKIESSGIPLI